MKPLIKRCVRNVPPVAKTRPKVAKSEEKREDAAKPVKNASTGNKKGLNHQGMTVVDQSCLHSAKESSIDQKLSQPITDRAHESGNHLVEEEEGINSNNHQVSPSKTHTMRELLVELKALVTGQGEKVARLVKELEEKVPTLPSAANGAATHADIALALLPLRSENIQLRRKINALNEQLRRYERQGNEPTATSDVEGLALHEKNSFLQKQLQESRKQAEQLEEERWGLHEALQQQNQQHDSAARHLQERERNVRCQKQRLEIELRRTESDLTDVHIRLQDLQRELEAVDREKQILKTSLKEREFEMKRMQDMTRALQYKMSILLSDLDVNAVQRKSASQDKDNLTWCLPEHEHTSYLPIAVGTNNNSSNICGLDQRTDSTAIQQLANNEETDIRGDTCKNGHLSLQKDVYELFNIPNSPAILIETMVPERESGVAVEQKELTNKSPTSNSLSMNEHHRIEDSGLFTPSRPRVIHDSFNKEPHHPVGNVNSNKTQEQPALSDSLSTFSSFTTQDDQEFRNGLAVLDSNISRLQRNLSSQWLRK